MRPLRPARGSFYLASCEPCELLVDPHKMNNELPSFPVHSWENESGRAPRDTRGAHVRGAAQGTVKHSSIPPPWLIPPEQHIPLRHQAEMMLTEYDGNVNVLPINSTRGPRKAYVSGAVSLFFPKCTTRVPVLEVENQGSAGIYVWWGRTWEIQLKCF